MYPYSVFKEVTVTKVDRFRSSIPFLRRFAVLISLFVAGILAAYSQTTRPVVAIVSGIQSGEAELVDGSTKEPVRLTVGMNLYSDSQVKSLSNSSRITMLRLEDSRTITCTIYSTFSTVAQLADNEETSTVWRMYASVKEFFTGNDSSTVDKYGGATDGQHNIHPEALPSEERSVSTLRRQTVKIVPRKSDVQKEALLESNDERNSVSFNKNSSYIGQLSADTGQVGSNEFLDASDMDIPSTNASSSNMSSIDASSYGGSSPQPPCPPSATEIEPAKPSKKREAEATASIRYSAGVALPDTATGIIIPLSERTGSSTRKNNEIIIHLRWGSKNTSREKSFNLTPVDDTVIIESAMVQWNPLDVVVFSIVGKKNKGWFTVVDSSTYQKITAVEASAKEQADTLAKRGLLLLAANMWFNAGAPGNSFRIYESLLSDAQLNTIESIQVQERLKEVRTILKNGPQNIQH